MACQKRNGPSSSVFHRERVSCTGDLYTHELKTCHVEPRGCYCCAQMGEYVVERLFLCRGTYSESNGEAHIENPMFVQVNLSSGTAGRSTTKFRNLHCKPRTCALYCCALFVFLFLDFVSCDLALTGCKS